MHVVRHGKAAARPGLAHSVHVDVRGLPSGRPLHYRFRALGELSPVGRTRTAGDACELRIHPASMAPLPESRRLDSGFAASRFRICGRWIPVLRRLDSGLCTAAG